MRRYLAFAAALVCAVLLSYAAGTSAQDKPDVPGIPPSITVPCGTNKVLAQGTFTPTRPITSYTVTLEATGHGRIMWLPGPRSHYSEMEVTCGWTYGVFCRYSYTTDYIDEAMQPADYRLWFWAGDCNTFPTPNRVRRVSVTVHP